jgi:metal-responsive CopG/Arc/MetJ family transcriptional regulator
MNDMITIRLPKKLLKELDAVVIEDHSSRSEIVREAIERYLELKRLRHVRKKTLPFAEAQGLLTDEDIFKSIS